MDSKEDFEQIKKFNIACLSLMLLKRDNCQSKKTLVEVKSHSRCRSNRQKKYYKDFIYY